MKYFAVLLYLSLQASTLSALPLVENGDEVSARDPLRHSIAQILMQRGRCSGTFITKTVVLTAGHCVEGQQAALTTVRLRASDNKWYQARAKKLILHPGYRLQEIPGRGWYVANDFGLIHVEPMPVAVKPVTISDPRDARNPFAVTVFGFGLKGPGSASQVLRKGEMNATVERIEYFYNEMGLFMSPTSRDQLTCPGDSGGPAIIYKSGKPLLIGVHSLSSGCKNNSDPRSYSQLPTLVSRWIRSNL